MTKQSFLAFIVLAVFTVNGWSQVTTVDLTEQQKIAVDLGCKAAVGSKNFRWMLCFRDDVQDLTKPTEIRGCAARLYDLESREFVGFKGSVDQAHFVLTPIACEKGGLQSILKWPIDETADLEQYMRSIYSFGRFEEFVDLIPDQDSPISQLLIQIQEQNLLARQNQVIEPRPIHPPQAPDQSRRANLPIKDLKHTTVQVFFGTDRQFVSGKQPAKTFSNERASKEKVTLGIVNVSIPVRHNFAELELPPIYKVIMSPDPNQYIVVKSIARMNYDQYFFELKKRVSQSGRKDAFVFVHGYNTSFEESAQRTAQLAFDLRFPGAPIFYSWPAETLLRYAIAEKNVEWSMSHLTQFLKDISLKSGAQEIHLVAHSMGNRALTKALDTLAKARALGTKKFKNVILAAPDVDQKDFQKIAPAVLSVTEKLTLYASVNDKALKISAKIHEAPRLGQAGNDTISINDMDTVDASKVDTSMLGHSYYGDNESVVKDLKQLIMFKLPVYHRYLEPKSNIRGQL